MKKKKILFVTTRSPFSSIFSGDRQRAKAIIEHISKKNNIDVLYSDYQKGKNTGKINNIFFRRSLKDKLKGIIISLLKLKPLQLGYFYSGKVEKFLKKNHKDYSVIIFHLIRSAQYLPKNFTGIKILEMTDIISKNYSQIIRSLSLLNPLTYIYFLERYFVKNYEKYCEKKFDKIIIASKNDLRNTDFKNLHNFIEIPNIVKVNKNIYKYNKSNYKILFVGNLNYLPNKIACKNFSKKILPQLNTIFPSIEFHIIGEITNIDKVFFNNIKNTFTHGPIKKLDKIFKNAICGICNVEIATGTQMKMLTYMSYGLPCVSSIVSYKNTRFQKGREVLIYKNNNEFIKIIQKLKENRRFSKKISHQSYLAMKKKYNFSKVLSNYNKII